MELSPRVYSYYHLFLAGNSLWEEYCVIADFKGEKDNQITADSGDQVIVLNKDSSGTHTHMHLN